MTSKLVYACDNCGTEVDDWIALRLTSTSHVTQADEVCTSDYIGPREFHSCVNVKCAERVVERMREQMEVDVEKILKAPDVKGAGCEDS